ncbi:hypothetical protein [Streptomyces sp. NPDC002763]|uniref:hypothetical protein n=1 Tax=Streptomyces sp. NPDC002763 TaxID=3154427 RepID=UPI003331181C
MRKLTKRISLAAASAAVAGGAVLGAGGTASAAASESAHVQRPAVGVVADDHRGDRGVAYRHNTEEDYRQDGHRARQHSDRFADSDRYDRRGHFYYWDDEDRCWKHDGNHRNDWDRYDHDSNRYDCDGDRHNHDSNWYDHDSKRSDNNSSRSDDYWNRSYND